MLTTDRLSNSLTTARRICHPNWSEYSQGRARQSGAFADMALLAKLGTYSSELAVKNATKPRASR